MSIATEEGSMTQEYTPTDQQVIDDYMPDDEDIGWDYRTMSIGEWKRLKIAAFDRWLAAHDAQVLADAWEDGRIAEHDEANGWGDAINPYRKAVTE